MPQTHRRHLLGLIQLGHLTQSGICGILFASKRPTTGHTCRPMTASTSSALACRARVSLRFHALPRISSGQRSHGPEIGLRRRQERHPQRLPAKQMRPAWTRRCSICSISWEGGEPHDWEIPRSIFSFNVSSFICYVSLNFFHQ